MCAVEFIHERLDWPNFCWNDQVLATPLASVRHKQGLLLGRMSELGFELRAEAGLSVLTHEVVKTSAIEGEQLDPAEVRSSIARRMGLDAGGLPESSRDVDGVVEMMLDATRNHAAPLTAERLVAWHASLFPTGRSGLNRIDVGVWRSGRSGPMQVVSGPIGRQTVHFEAPAADRVEGEMGRFLAWYNGDVPMDPVMKAGIAHLWFVTIHPFEDGNGRIARAIADMTLARGDGVAERFYSMSERIEAQRKEYYLHLESAQRGDMNVTPWLVWFVRCLDSALDSTERLLDAVLHKARVWRRMNSSAVNDRQRLVLNRMLDAFKGHLNTSKYSKLAKCSQDTALRDIRDLLERGVIVRNPGGGRSTSYRLARVDELPA